MAVHHFLLILGSYLLGSLPSGYLVSLAAGGVDIRQRGSGNPGAANVYTILGPGPGIATLIGDILKGYFPVWIAQHAVPGAENLALLCGAAAIVGHAWMFFLSFNGGKAVATTAGVFLALLPGPMLIALAIFLFSVWFSKHIAVGSMAGAAAFPFITILAGSPPSVSLLAFFSCALILIRHVSNVGRLREGTEANYDKGSDLEKS